MIRVILSLNAQKGIPYSQSGVFRSEKSKNESYDDFEKRCWREKMSTNADGVVVIPAMALKKCLQSAASVLGEKIKGKGSKTYAKLFRSGIVPEGDIPVGVKADDVKPETFFCDAQPGKLGGGRVARVFPMVYDWSGTATLLIVAPEISRDVFERTVEAASLLVGLGRFRPENGGLNGRFSWKIKSWTEL